MNRNFIVRPIKPTDYSIVYQLIKTAFETAEHRDGSEQDFAVTLRNGTDYLPELDLVAESDGKLIGHIMFTGTEVTRPDGAQYNTLLVAPLSVLLECRSLGVGSALMNEGLRIAREMGYGSAFLVGDPHYYQRFGYRPASVYNIHHESLPAEYVMAKELIPDTLTGVEGLIRM